MISWLLGKRALTVALKRFGMTYGCRTESSLIVFRAIWCVRVVTHAGLGLWLSLVLKIFRGLKFKRFTASLQAIQAYGGLELVCMSVWHGSRRPESDQASTRLSVAVSPCTRPSLALPDVVPE